MNLYNTSDKLINCIIFRLIEENPMLIYPHFSKKLIKIQVSFTFLNLRRFWVGPNFEKFCVDILFIDLQAFLKNMSHYMLVVFVVTLCWGPLSNIRFQLGNRRERPLCQVTSNNVPNMVILHTMDYDFAYNLSTIIQSWDIRSLWTFEM